MLVLVCLIVATIFLIKEIRQYRDTEVPDELYAAVELIIVLLLFWLLVALFLVADIVPDYGEELDVILAQIQNGSDEKSARILIGTVLLESVTFLCSTTALFCGIRRLHNTRLCSEGFNLVSGALLGYFAMIASVGGGMFGWYLSHFICGPYIHF